MFWLYWSNHLFTRRFKFLRPRCPYCNALYFILLLLSLCTSSINFGWIFSILLKNNICESFLFPGFEVGRAENNEESIRVSLITATQGFPNSSRPLTTYRVDFLLRAPNIKISVKFWTEWERNLINIYAPPWLWNKNNMMILPWESHVYSRTNKIYQLTCIQCDA
jgi:hypothetical protein